MTRAQFLRLSPRARGYAVYMLGGRADVGSAKSKAWIHGQRQAVLDVIDGEE